MFSAAAAPLLLQEAVVRTSAFVHYSIQRTHPHRRSLWVQPAFLDQIVQSLGVFVRKAAAATKHCALATAMVEHGQHPHTVKDLSIARKNGQLCPFL